MADEQHRQPQPRPQISQQRQHLRLYGDIERRDRLIGDQKIRTGRQRASDADALALTAAELVRVAIGVLR